MTPRPRRGARGAGSKKLALSFAVLGSLSPVAFGKEAGSPSTERAPALGRLTFPVTASEIASQHFVRGLLALHSFWYEEARDEFRAATRVQPSFAMGFWGEALTFFHPVWGAEDVAAEKRALDAVPAQPAITARELAYLDAARTLVGDGDFAAHAARFRDAMRAVHQRFPDDDEAAALYAVAILGTVDRKSPAYRSRAEAGALMLELFARRPDHPGAAHYIIHAFDDPEHARIALPAARRYARIAPEAFHALHMPSHIFVHLGMWREAAASNESSWAASREWVKRRKLDSSLVDFHSLSWLHAIYLELGDRLKANEMLERFREAMAAARDDRAWLRVEYLKMVLKNAVEADSFADLESKLAPLAAGPSQGEQSDTGPAYPKGQAGLVPDQGLAGASCHPARESDDARAARRERGYRALLRAEAALARRDPGNALKAVDDYRATLTAEDRGRDVWRILELTARGRAIAMRGDVETGRKMIEEAADCEDREAPSGPVERGVTARERLGELFIALGRPKDAEHEFRRALELHPRRARALLGCARAATAAGDPDARNFWNKLASVWTGANEDTPGLTELRRATAGP